MRNASSVGLCWAMILGLVAVALGQQPAPPGGQAAPQSYDTVAPPAQPPQAQPATGQPRDPAPVPNRYDVQPNSASRNSNVRERSMMPAPDRSVLTGNRQSPQPAMIDGQRRGELGVWMGESGGPGVQILRVTQGSAADQAGLRVGDIILQVNGRGASSAQGAAQLIRQIPIGQSGTLTIWRDGDQQQLQVTMRPAREMARDLAYDASHQVGFRTGETPASGDLASRTMRLEQQINSLTQELASLRQELAQLRNAGPVQTGFNAEANQPAVPQQQPTRYNESPREPAPPAAANPTPPPVSAPPEPAKPAAEPAKPAAPPAAPPAPATEKSPSNDLFGPAPAQPKSEEKPKTEEKPKADEKAGSDDLFK